MLCYALFCLCSVIFGCTGLCSVMVIMVCYVLLCAIVYTVMLSYALLCSIVLCYALSCSVMPRYALVLCSVISVMLCYTPLCSVIYVILCYALLCSFMRCYALLWSVMLWRVLLFMFGPVIHAPTCCIALTLSGAVGFLLWHIPQLNALPVLCQARLLKNQSVVGPSVLAPQRMTGSAWRLQSRAGRFIYFASRREVRGEGSGERGAPDIGLMLDRGPSTSGWREAHGHFSVALDVL